ETEVVEIEAKLDKLVKLCGGMIEAGKAYVTANKLFINGIRDLSQQCKKDQMISDCLEKCGEGLQEIVNYHMILFDQAQRSVKQQLHNFVKDDVRKFKDTKKHFDKVREDLEIAQVKNAQAPRNKLHEVEEATSTLNFTRKCFRHLALDYVLQINVLQAKKKFEILDAMLSFMHAQYSLYQQGYNLLDEIDPYMKKLAAELDQLVIDSAMEKREMEHKHATIQQRDFAYDDPKLEFNVNAPNGLVMEGYLFKRASNAFKTWNRRWFSIQNSQLVYQKKLKDSLTVVVEDLRLCSVKPCEDIERRFCFEVVSPTNCITSSNCRLDRTASPSISSIDSANEPRERSGRGESILQRILCLPGNQQCCDCGQAEPRWASINLGILLCIECSGIHRSLGVHCSKVRSLTLDSWEPELLKVCSNIQIFKHALTITAVCSVVMQLMCELGNSIINHIYEGSCEEQGLNGSTDVLVFESVVDSVTEEECEVSEDSSNETELEPEASDPEDLRELDPGALLYKACQARNLPVMAEALAHGADVNSVNEEDEGKSPLIQAVIGGSLIACEFLLQNGADVNQRDHRGRGPLHHATYLGHTGQVCLFLKRGATQNDGDEDGQDPLSIAVQAANADIVTLLRLARMNEEMRESEGPLGQPGQYSSSSPTEQQYKRCIQEFICLNIAEC
uniref:Arf-GAP with coiled-coil, ANK repeat and PH domain-containing protein n=1 Tax=Sinocyclocheilus grahami TaxID=75366 RepID=A0A672NKB7_SINGR